MLEFLPLIAIVVLFYFLLIRPTQRRQRATGQMQNSLNVGDEVMLTSGFFGLITDIGDDRIDLELAEGVTVMVNRAAVASVVKPEGYEPDDEPDSVTNNGTDNDTDSGTPDDTDPSGDPGIIKEL